MRCTCTAGSSSEVRARFDSRFRIGFARQERGIFLPVDGAQRWDSVDNGVEGLFVRGIRRGIYIIRVLFAFE